MFVKIDFILKANVSRHRRRLTTIFSADIFLWKYVNFTFHLNNIVSLQLYSLQSIRIQLIVSSKLLQELLNVIT